MPSRAPGAVPPQSFALTCTLTAIVLSIGGIWIHTRGDLVALELEGGHQQGGPLPQAVTAAGWGFALTVCYGVGLWLATVAAQWAWRTRTGRRIVGFARTATIIAVATHVVENVLLLGIGIFEMPGWWLTGITAAATLKYSALLPAGVVALSGAAVLLWRCVRHSPEALLRRAQHDPGVVPPSPVDGNDPPANDHEAARANRWRNAYTVPGAHSEVINERWARGEHTTGFCLSGGGIRAASVALGALQSLRCELLDAHYLTSVSGGGYTAGAWQQALTDAGDGVPSGTPLHDPAAVFGPGTPELHHIRRHSSYLADTPGELLKLLGRLAGTVALSLSVLFGPAIALGIAIRWLYQRVPLTALPAQDQLYPEPRPGAFAALGILAAAAFLLALFARGESAGRERAARLAYDLTVLSAATATLVLVVPMLVGAASWLLSNTNRAIDIGGSVGAVLLTYLSTIAAIFWRHRAVLGGQASGPRRRSRTGGIPAALPQGLVQRLLVIITTGVLAGMWLLLLGAAATTITAPAALAAAITVATVGLLLGVLFDVTSLSLHPFYRQRLARAFAVRPVRRHTDGQIVAEPYPPGERTTLSRYGSTAESVRFPEVIFAAAANLTGPARTPPGLNAVSYTMSAQWCGGPDVGWVRTRDLEGIVPNRFQRDLTVQGAVAVSGAAFASAMGRSSRWYQVLLAVSGARLGTWLPNPGFIRRGRDAAQRGDWAYPWLPNGRHLPYLLREVFGVHSHRDRLLHVTDGAHYDNLGLVELFRRRCTQIFCIDASNEEPPTAASLTHALTLATQELGVRVHLDQPWRAEPGSEQAWDPDSPLTTRLAQSPIITGTIYYPPESGLNHEIRGRLVVARAVLWPELPYPLLSYAARHSEFPHDNTSDQWFDHAKFSAYTELGRRLGAAAREAGPSLQLPTARPNPDTSTSTVAR